ncbi:WD40 repeat-like protein [Suillus decipiens]|nr:WD40 repeat-like protein [Suillus decipiens]
MSSSIVQETSAIKPCQKFEGHTNWVTGAIHLPDRQRMMTCSLDGSLRVWNLKSGKQIGDDWRDGDSGVWTIALSPNGKKVVSGSKDGGVRLWDIDTGKIITKWMGHTQPVVSVCWSQDGRRVVSGSHDGTARVWDVENEETILGPVKTGHEHVYAVVYSPDASMFATAGHDELSPASLTYESAVKIWDEKTGELVATLKGHTNWVWCLAWTADGKTLISGSVDCSIRTWNTQTWKEIAVLDGHTDAVYAIAISPNGRILASASWDNKARLWNLDNGQPISSPLHHTNFPTRCVSFSSDGKLLATGCFDRNAYMWDVIAILNEAGLDDLLDKPDKSLPAAGATRPKAVRQSIKVPNRIPQGFFNDIPNRAQLPRHPLSLPSHRHRRTFRSRFLSFFRLTHPDGHDAPFRPRPFHWVRSRLFARQSDTDIEPPSAEVDVPHCQAKRRNASGRERRRPIPRPMRTNATAGSSRPPNSTVAQQSGGMAQVQSSLQTAPPVVGNTVSSTTPYITIKYPTLWTRFWLCICCASPEYTHS